MYGGDSEIAKNFSSFLNALRRRKYGDTPSRLLLLVKLPYPGVRTSSLLNIHQSPAFCEALMYGGEREIRTPGTRKEYN